LLQPYATRAASAFGAGCSGATARLHTGLGVMISHRQRVCSFLLAVLDNVREDWPWPVSEVTRGSDRSPSTTIGASGRPSALLFRKQKASASYVASVIFWERVVEIFFCSCAIYARYACDTLTLNVYHIVVAGRIARQSCLLRTDSKATLWINNGPQSGRCMNMCASALSQLTFYNKESYLFYNKEN